MAVRYPSGVMPPSNEQPSMKSYKVKPVTKASAPWLKRKSKYNAHRIYYDGHWFDSKTECGFYIYLKRIHAVFQLHVRYTIKKHHLTPSGIPIRKRSYTPDFVRYRNQADLKAGKPYEVDDVKGIGQIPASDSMKFGAFEDVYDIPVIIIRWKHNHWIRQRKCF